VKLDWSLLVAVAVAVAGLVVQVVTVVLLEQFQMFQTAQLVLMVKPVLSSEE
jgi:cytochrome c oxidase subunit IV